VLPSLERTDRIPILGTPVSRPKFCIEEKTMEEKGKYDVDVGETKDVPRKEWIAYAYPLQLITVQVQGRRDSLQGDMAQLLRAVADLIDAGQLSGAVEDDDFGYVFKVEDDRQESIFPDT
jgi:hypothetical protein